MNSSPKRYFHTFKESELFYNENEIFDENQNQNIMVQKSTNFNKKTPNNLLNTFVGDIYKTLKDENNKEKTVSTDKNQSLENIEFLKKIYKPRKQTKEKLKDLEKNVQKNRFVQRLERVVDNQNKNNSERNSNFRIKLDKNFSSYNNNEFPNKDNHQNNNDRYLDLCKKEEEKNLDKEEKKYCNSNLIKNKEGIKQNKTYKLIEGKTLENKSKKEIKPENNFKPQNNNAEKNNCNPFKNTENAIDNNENQILGAKQLNSFKISVNLTPTFHLNLNSTMQKYIKKVSNK